MHVELCGFIYHITALNQVFYSIIIIVTIMSCRSSSSSSCSSGTVVVGLHWGGVYQVFFNSSLFSRSRSSWSRSSSSCSISSCSSRSSSSSCSSGTAAVGLHQGVYIRSFLILIYFLILVHKRPESNLEAFWLPVASFRPQSSLNLLEAHVYCPHLCTRVYGRTFDCQVQCQAATNKPSSPAASSSTPPDPLTPAAAHTVRH